MTQPLHVFHENNPVGQITLDERRRWIFQYDPRWLNDTRSFPISIQLPLQNAAFNPDHAKPFFANLLPEGDVRQLIAKRNGISSGNDFALLAAIGGDCAGALSVQESDEISSGSNKSYRELTSLELSHAIDEMRHRPLLTIDGKARLSLAGAQEKLPAYVANGKVFIPENGAPSTHILKPPMQYFEDSVQNELFCLQLARQLGLMVPAASMMDDGVHKILMVVRYDRKISESNVERLHQEDFCQAIGKMPDQKYQNEGGPAFEDCFEILDHYATQPALDKKRLIEWAVFNFLIGNCDAHAKNISVLIAADAIQLAPFYDLMSTVVYEGLSEKMAMKIGGHYERHIIAARHWEKFADDIGVKSSIVLQTVKEFSKTLPELAQREGPRFTAQHGGVGTISKIISEIETTVRRFL